MFLDISWEGWIGIATLVSGLAAALAILGSFKEFLGARRQGAIRKNEVPDFIEPNRQAKDNLNPDDEAELAIAMKLVQQREIETGRITDPLEQFLLKYDERAIKASASGGNLDANYLLACTASAIGDHPKAIRHFKWGVEHGDAGAMFRMSFYYQGLLEKNDVQSLSLLERAAALKHPRACATLGMAFELGERGKPKDLARAYELYNAAQELGNQNALILCGRILTRIGKPDAQKKARELFEKAARLETSQARLNSPKHLSSATTVTIIFIGTISDICSAPHFPRKECP